MLGFSVSVRKASLLLRIRNLISLAIVMGSIGTAIGYAVATRGVTDPGDDPGDDVGQAG